MHELAEKIKDRAVSLGFDLVGIAPASEARYAKAFRSWLRKGFHADMQWMERKPERRSDPRNVVEQARSVIALGLSYYVADPPPSLWDDPSRGRIARYAWGPDYHDLMEEKLQELVRFLHEEGAGAASRYYVDTGPVLERSHAARAGLGFVGRNTMLISPAYGSYVFLAEIITNVEMEYDHPADDEGAAIAVPGTSQKKASCGQCTRCLDVCPTKAFDAAYVVNSERCISYLTIEFRESIPLELRPLMGSWIYGCDECQQICPWVQRYSKPKEKHFLSFDPDFAAPSLIEIMGLDDEAFREKYRGTPVKRTKRRGLLRNVAIALGNWGSEEALPALKRAVADEEPLIAEHAAWAVERICDHSP